MGWQERDGVEEGGKGVDLTTEGEGQGGRKRAVT